MQQQWDKPRRPSPVIFLTGFVEAAKESVGYIFLAIVSTYFRKNSEGRDNSLIEKFSWLMVGSFAAVIILKFQKIFAWFFTLYWVESDKVVLKKGLLVKRQVELPFEKIQTIQLHQTMLHRLTNTCALTMDTAGSAKAEFVIEALNMDDARSLQQWVRSLQKDVPKQENLVVDPVAKPLLSLGVKDFIKLCISENHLKSLALIATFIFSKAYDFSDQLGFDFKGFLTNQSTGSAVSIWSISMLLSFALFIAIIFSSIRVILRFYDYRLRQSNLAFEMSWGLFTRHRKTTPFSKVEFITWWSSWIRRKMDLYLLRLHSLAESETVQAMHIQMPVTSKVMLAHITSVYMPAMPSESGIEPTGIQKAIFFRKIIIIAFPITIVAASVAWFYVQWHALWVLLWLFYFILSEYSFYRNYRIWITEDALQISRGIWGREQVVIYLPKIVSVTLRTTPFQRKNGYANLELHLPGKIWVIPYLKKEQANYWADYITLKIEYDELKN